MSSTDKTFFELKLRNELNVKQFLGSYAIDNNNVYMLNSAGSYEKDSSFDSFSSHANGISKVTTSDGREAYIVYGDGDVCIQATIAGSSSVLKYAGIKNIDVFSAFNLGTNVVIAAKDND